MPPKKRKASAKATEPAPETTTNARGTETVNTAAATRPRRSSILPVHDEPAAKKVKGTAKAQEKVGPTEIPEESPKKRGRPARKVVEAEAEEVDEVAPVAEAKKRGRPAKSLKEEVAPEPEPGLDESDDGVPVVEAKKKRGRQAKGAKTEVAPEPVSEPEPGAEEAPVAKKAKRAGRPAKSAPKEVPVEETKPDSVTSEPKKRGRPSKDATALKRAAKEESAPEDAPPTKRGRKANNAKSDSAPNPSAPVPQAKKRGRPSKATAEPDEQDDEEAEAIPAKKAGRLAKIVAEPEATVEDVEPKKRGRPKGATAKEQTRKTGAGRPAAAAKSEPVEAGAPAKKRGRPAKAAVEAPEVTPKKAKGRGKAKKESAPTEDAAQLEQELADDTGLVETSKKRKAPATTTSNTKGKKSKKETVADEEDVDDSNEINPTEATTEIAGDHEDDRQFWLMKAEPESRLEKTPSGKDVDVRFSIDDLAAKDEPEPWEGIRNLQAQKHMRNMSVGDLAFFYASNTKQPGIVGIMEIVQEVSPDQSAFDLESPYYDEKSKPEAPKWQLVHVAFRRKFAEKVTLKELQKYTKDGGTLESMQMLKQTRLSVSKVTPAEWKFVISLAGEEEAPAGETELGTDFASAFEAPAALDNVSTTIDEVFDQAHATASETLGKAIDTFSPAAAYLSSEVHNAETTQPATEEPLPSTETDATSTSGGGGGGIFHTLKSVVGLGPKSPSRAPSAKPASRAGSRAPSVKPSSRAPSRAPSARPGSRAGSAVPASQPEATSSSSNGNGIAASPVAAAKSKPPRASSSAQSGKVPESILEEQDGEDDDDEEFVVVDHTDASIAGEPTIDEALARPLSYA